MNKLVTGFLASISLLLSGCSGKPDLGPGCSGLPASPNAGLHIQLELPQTEISRNAVPKGTEMTLRIYKQTTGCALKNFATRGGCAKSEGDPLGIYFPQFEATCQTPSNEFTVSDFPSDREVADALRIFETTHDDGAFPGCYKPTTWQTFAKDLCSRSCKELIEEITTSGLSYDLPSLSCGTYYLEVERKRFSQGKDWVEYSLPVTKVEVSGPKQIFSAILEEIFTTVD